ncbi:thioredoxin [Gordonia phage Patio]|uniref:Thioredoxin n=1 Tax=Gordonia phage Patio TaxID=2041515 RepID=A0A2D2W4N4_9CAUD|nr:thioredoxin domain [Gordonia phage Patio]ATS93146.1 thioredoxin [Gordonia phage Patio]
MKFDDLHNEDTLAEVQDRRSNDRWLMLVGQREEPLYEYFVEVISRLPHYRRLRFAKGDTWFGDDGLAHAQFQFFLEKHMVSTTPAILLSRRGEVQTMIAGAIPFERLLSAVDELCADTPATRLADVIAEMSEDGSLPGDIPNPEDHPLPSHRTEAGWPNCATCDGGGCPDCTDPA